MPTSTANSLFPLRVTGTQTVDEIAQSGSTCNSVSRLTRRLAAGDEDSFREFHELYFDRLYQFLLVVSRGQEQEAREALQETFVRVARYAREFKTEEFFWSWLKAVARSAARDGGRKQRRYFTLLQRFALGAHITQNNHEAANSMGDLLEEAMEELDLLDRQMVEAKYLEGATVKEISLKTGLTDKAVESRLLRVRRQLRERLLNKLRSP